MISCGNGRLISLKGDGVAKKLFICFGARPWKYLWSRKNFITPSGILAFYEIIKGGAMANVCLRGIDDRIKNLLKAEAAKNGISVNRLILRYINKGIGLNPAGRNIQILTT